MSSQFTSFWTKNLHKYSVWAQCRTVLGRDEKEYRQDAHGNLIRFSHYGDRNAEHGWEIDHVVPLAAGGVDDLSNMQALHWKANASKGARLFRMFSLDPSQRR